MNPLQPLLQPPPEPVTVGVIVQFAVVMLRLLPTMAKPLPSGIATLKLAVTEASAPNVTARVPVKVPGATDESNWYVGRVAPASVYTPPPDVGSTGVGMP